MWILTICWLWLGDDPSHYLVLKNGKVLVLREAAKQEGSQFVFTLPDGQKGSLPASMVDPDKTRARNERAAAEHERAEHEKAARAEAEAKSKPEEAPVRKPIALRSTYDLPTYDSSANSMSGVTAITTNDSEPGNWRTYTSSDPVYVARDRINSSASGTVVECELAVNLPTGAKNVRLQAKAYFDDNTSETIQQSSSPANLGISDKGSVSFSFSSKGKLLQITYQVTSEIEKTP